MARARSRARRARFASARAIAVSASAIRAAGSEDSAPGRTAGPRAPEQPARSATADAKSSAPVAASPPERRCGRAGRWTARPLRAGGSATKQPPLLEARVAVASHDDVIEEIDAEDPSSFEEAARDGQVLLARRGIPQRMVVREDDAGRGHGHGGQEHLARMDDARVQAADRDDLPPEDLLSGVQIDAHEVLPVHATDV